MPKVAAIVALLALVAPEAKKQHIDLYLVDALVTHESEWNPRAINPTSGALGLGQHLPSTLPACRHDLTSEACSAAQARLLDGPYNLRLTVKALGGLRRWCKQRTGRTPTEAGLLMAYGGYNRLKQGQLCGLRKDKRGRWRPVPIPGQVKEILDLKRSRARLFKVSRPRH